MCLRSYDAGSESGTAVSLRQRVAEDAVVPSPTVGGGLTLEQELRILACHDGHGGAVEAALGSYPYPDDRMARRSTLEASVRESGEPVALLVAWMHRLIHDETVRPLDADLEVRWPKEPDPADAALVVRLAADPACAYYEIRAALQLAERALAQGPAGDALVSALLELRARLECDRLHSSEFFRAKVLPWVLRLVAETTPADLPDLAFLDPHDHWAPVVVTTVHASDDPATVGRALLHLASPRGGKPSKAWWARTAALLVDAPGLAGLAVELLDAVTTVDATARDDERDGWDVPDPFLLTPANELLARGLAWARQLAPSDEACEVLGRVALRSAAMVWVVPAHRMLCPKLAVAAVDALCAVGSPAAREQLATVIDEVRVPALLRRIGPHLGLTDAEVAARVAGLRARGPLPRPGR